jgi:crossover junction endodeoxyribonuclease RusA
VTTSRAKGKRGAVTITLPLPHKDLSPNARVHWSKKHSQRKKQRNTAGVIAYSSELGQAKLTRAKVQATFYHTERRNRDGDNFLAMLKGAFDGLADAGVVANDSGFVHMPVRFEIDKDNPRVEVTIEPMEDAA